MNLPSIVLPQLPKIEKLRSKENSKLVNVGVLLISDDCIPNLMFTTIILEIICNYNLTKIIISYSSQSDSSYGYSSSKREKFQEWSKFCERHSYEDLRKIYFIPDGLSALLSYCPEDKKDSEEVKEVLNQHLPLDLSRFVGDKLINKDIEDILTDVNKFYFIKGLNKHSCDYKLRSQYIYSLFSNTKFVSMRGIDMNIFSEVYLNYFGYIRSIFEDIYAIYFNSDFTLT